ncbi:MAG TPA: histone deacetylase [Thermoanaerobaculia bacterium]|nr:histone deacetylase [Thermoanaerobaculia bacterium]
MLSPSLIRNLRRGRRRLARLAGPPRVRFVYSRRYQVELPGALYDPRRGEHILGALDAAGLLDWTAVHRAAPVPFRHLRRIHTDEYLDSLNQPGALARIVGLQIPEEVAERLLESQRTMVGGTLLATRLALEDGHVAVNLGGGLHHAFSSRGERFCVYNDVAAAVADLRERGSGVRILIVDLDLHDGDGTRAILAGDPAVHHFTIHNRTSPGVKAKAETVVELGHYVDDATYLEAVRSRLPEVFASFQPGLVFYLAGTDPAADDQIGDWKISAEALLERDRLVLACAREGSRKLPLVIILAGGYGINSWRYSARFFSVLLNRGKPVEPPGTEELILLRYRNMAREFSEHELTGDAPNRPVDDWGLSEEDLFSALGGPHRPQRMLGFYSRQGLELALERAGLLDRIRGIGFERPLLEMDVENPAGDTVRLYGDPGKRELLIEVRVLIDRRSLPDMALLRIEWLLLQNPRAHFTPDRPQLPGQAHPGLGMLHDIIALLVLVCDRLQLDGLIFVPSHFHVASHGRKTMRFLRPEDEGLYRAFEKTFENVPLAEAAEAVLAGRVVDARTGQPVVWQPAPMIFPVSDRLKEMVRGDEYEKKIAAEAARQALVVRP